MGKRQRQRQAVEAGEASPAAAAVRGWPPASYLMGLALFGVYLFFPYWELIDGEGKRWEVAAWLGLVALAVGWGWCAAPLGPLAGWRKPAWANRVDLGVLAGLLVALEAWHWRHLRLAFCWQGDEEFHINRYMHLEQMCGPSMAAKRWVLAVLLVAAVALALAIRQAKRRQVGWLLGLAAVILYGTASVHLAAPQTGYYLQRYPILLLPLQALLANRWLGTFWQEAWHRQAALLPMWLALGWLYLWLRRDGLRWWQAAGAAVILALVPVVSYQTKLLYIEPLLVLWYTGVLWLAWTYSPPGSLAGIYRVAAAGAAGGLIKETALPFQAAVGIWCLWQLARLPGVRVAAKAGHLARLAAVVTLPTVPYLYLRMESGERTYHAAASNLWNPELYANWWISVRDYVTVPILVAAVAGLALLWWQRRHRGAVLLAALSTVGYFLFLSMDYLQNVSLARFMLHFWPLVAVGLAGLFAGLAGETVPSARWRPALAAGIGLVLLGVNLAYRPPGPERLWGGGTQTSQQERHFPLNETFAHVKSVIQPGMSIVFFGNPYTYYHMGFYLAKHGLQKHPWVPVSATPPEGVSWLAWLAAALPHASDIPPVHQAILIYHFEAASEVQPEGVPGIVKRGEFRVGTRGYAVYEYHDPRQPR